MLTFKKPSDFRVTDHLDDVRMLERFAPLQAEARDAELAHVVHPLLEIGEGGMRERVIVLVAVMAIEVALFRHIKMGGPWLGIENPDGLLEVLEHLCVIAAAGAKSSSGERTRLACWRWRPRHRELSLLSLVASLSKVRFGDGAETSTRGRVRSPDWNDLSLHAARPSRLRG